VTSGECQCGTPETIVWAPVFAFADEWRFGWHGWSGGCEACGGRLHSSNEQDDAPGRLLPQYSCALRAHSTV
jgi:hypothetical protein